MLLKFCKVLLKNEGGEIFILTGDFFEIFASRKVDVGIFAILITIDIECYIS